jgi:hypothetical protein
VGLDQRPQIDRASSKAKIEAGFGIKDNDFVFELLAVDVHRCDAEAIAMSHWRTPHLYPRLALFRFFKHNSRPGSTARLSMNSLQGPARRLLALLDVEAVITTYQV